MAVINVAGSGTGNTGSLAADTLFHIESGELDLSTDGGTTYIRFGTDDKVIFSTGLTVTYRNSRPVPAILKTMAA